MMVTIASTRATYQWVSGDVVFAAEDALAKVMSSVAPLALTRTQRVARRATRRIPAGTGSLAGIGLARLRSRLATPVTGALFASVIDRVDADLPLWFKGDGPRLLWLIDTWEDDAPRVSRLVADVDLLLLAYADAADLVRGCLPAEAAQRVHVLPLFLSPADYPPVPVEKSVDLLQVGRADPRLHRWALDYAGERGRSYVFQRRSDRGVYYFENGTWDLDHAQLSSPRLRRLMASSRIALVSPPDRTDPGRTGRVSAMTPRYLEAALSYSVPVGSAPRGGEYADSFPPDFTAEVASYEEFSAACDHLLVDSGHRERRAVLNREYVIRDHGPEARAQQIRQLMSAMSPERVVRA